MKNDVDHQPYLKDYAKRPKEEYIEYLRRRIVAMQVDIDRLDREHRK